MKHKFGLQKVQEEQIKRQYMPYTKERSPHGLLRSAFRFHFRQHSTTLCSIARKKMQTRVRDNTAEALDQRVPVLLARAQHASLWERVIPIMLHHVDK